MMVFASGLVSRVLEIAISISCVTERFFAVACKLMINSILSAISCCCARYTLAGLEESGNTVSSAHIAFISGALISIIAILCFMYANWLIIISKYTFGSGAESRIAVWTNRN
jgi:hypothetical protein